MSGYVARHSKPYSEAAEVDAHRPNHVPQHRKPTAAEALAAVGSALLKAFGRTR